MMLQELYMSAATGCRCLGTNLCCTLWWPLHNCLSRLLSLCCSSATPKDAIPQAQVSVLVGFLCITFWIVPWKKHVKYNLVHQLIILVFGLYSPGEILLCQLRIQDNYKIAISIEDLDVCIILGPNNNYNIFHLFKIIES